jgi:very-short-patch-repair endonuclease
MTPPTAPPPSSSPQGGGGKRRGGRPDLQTLTGFARDMRKSPTDVETRLWRHLRNKRMEGFKFRRQQPIGTYIVDFVCLEARLVVELDGGQHALDTAYDEDRDEWLKSEGYRVLRFWNNDVLGNMEGVLERIKMSLPSPQPSPPPPSSSPRGGGGKRRGGL